LFLCNNSFRRQHFVVGAVKQHQGNAMQDLNVITKLNSQAVQTHAIKTRDAGKFGLAKYTGLNFQSWADFDTEAERNAASIEWNNAGPGHRTTLHDPERAAA
jgi:hypothetical protein